MTAGQGLHARSVGPAHHTLLLLAPGGLLVLALDFTKEIVLDIVEYFNISCNGTFSPYDLAS